MPEDKVVVGSPEAATLFRHSMGLEVRTSNGYGTYFGTGLVLARVLEHESRPGNEIFHRLRHKYLRGSRQGADTSSDRDGDTGDVVSVERLLARMEPCSDLEVLAPPVGGLRQMRSPRAPSLRVCQNHPLRHLGAS